MNILLFNGSPRKYGNTYRLSRRFCELATESGHSVYTLDDISPCTHCSSCLNHEGECPLSDNFLKSGISIRDNIDCIVIASPIHYFSMTPKALGFLTRLYPYPLTDKIFGLILVSGSDFDDGGASLVVNQFKAIDNYCGSITVTPYHKVTYDKVWEVSDLDTEGLLKLLHQIEWTKDGRDSY